MNFAILIAVIQQILSNFDKNVLLGASPIKSSKYCTKTKINIEKFEKKRDLSI